MKIYITRHGETIWNQEGKMQGWQNSNLTENGILNAKKLGIRLQDIAFDYAYCSPAGRAVETVGHILANQKTQVISCEALKEMGFGKWEGMKHTEVAEVYAEESSNFWNTPELYTPIEGETFEELLERVRTFMNYIIKEVKAENILIVSHAICIKAIYAVLKGLDLKAFWTPPFIEGTSLTIVEVNNEKAQIICEADTSHLDQKEECH